MFNIEDISVLWDNELIYDQWFILAQKDYYSRLLKPLELQVICLKPLIDIHGYPQCCNIKKDHKGPCFLIRFKLIPTRNSSNILDMGYSYKMELINGLLEPDLTINQVNIYQNLDLYTNQITINTTTTVGTTISFNTNVSI